MLVLETLHELLQKRLQTSPRLVWVDDQPTPDDLQHILKEGLEDSRFDPHGLRREMIEALQGGQAKLLCKRCTTAKGLVVVYSQDEFKIPWELFATIFQALGGSGWRFVLFANPKPRIFPAPGEEPGPGEVNGGYAWPGEPRTIVIYRLEECYRVLVHEAIHAAGLDNFQHSEQEREARTETWAELFLVAIQAKRSKATLKRLWKLQSQWIADQEALLQQDHNVKDSSNYAWRYTCGRRQILEELGLKLPPPSTRSRVAVSNSLRFTSPKLVQNKS
jgi:hypothetical protein